MATAPVSKLKASLSEYLRLVKAGEEVVVTERGRAIARLVQYDRGGPTVEWEEELVRRGILRRARKKLGPEFWAMPLVPDPEGLALKALLEEREEGR